MGGYVLMDFVYTDSKGIEIGFLRNCSIDLEIGTYDKGSNDFQITISQEERDPNLTYESLIYCENTEYGGVVKSLEIDTESGEIIIGGICPRALLKGDYIQPKNRKDEYYFFNGEANKCIKEYIGSSTLFLNYIDNTEKSLRINKNLNDFFIVSEENSGFQLNYASRYSNTLQTFETMLLAVGAKLSLIWKNGKIELSVVPIYDYSPKLQFDNDYGLQIIAKRDTYQYNHCIGLGKGDLQERQVVHVFKINDEYFELNEIDDVSKITKDLNTMIYDFSSVESVQELIDGTKTKLKEAQTNNSIEIKFENLDVEIGDIVGAKEYITGISLRTSIVQKILKCTFYQNYSDYDIEYKVGE